MLKICKRLLVVISLFVFVSTFVCSKVYANETGVYIVDNEHLLSDSEVKMLTSDMGRIASHGKIIFVTTSSKDAATTAESWYRNIAGKSSGVIFLIDMGCRQIYMFSDGAVYDKLGVYYANGITDNVYSYATNGKYYDCARTAFEQVGTVLEGDSLFIPMKYINSFFLSLSMSILLMYALAVSSRRRYSVFDDEGEDNKLLKYVERHNHVYFYNIQEVLDKVVYHISFSGGSSSDWSSSGFGGGGGFSGGGGGHSGGGGGHGF